MQLLSVYFGLHVLKCVTIVFSVSDLLWQEVDSKWIFVYICPQLDLSQDLQKKFTNSGPEDYNQTHQSPQIFGSSLYLVGEGVAHDEGGVSHGTAQIHQTTLGQNDDMTAVLQTVTVHLRESITEKRES